MTIVVCVRVNDGIVLASDSATSFTDPTTGLVVKVYNHADKIFNLVKGMHIGAMTYGSGAIGSASISTLSKDLRQQLAGGLAGGPFGIDLDNFTIRDVAGKALAFFKSRYDVAYPDGVQNYHMGYRVCGYSSAGQLPEAWEIIIRSDGATGPFPLYDHDNEFSFGPRWNGEVEALDRLILGVGSRARDAFQNIGLTADAAEQAYLALVRALRIDLHMLAMPIQDAIDLARFLADTAARFAHFNIRAPTVGGAIELATITKHEGFRWINRKHFYNVSLNPPGAS